MKEEIKNINSEVKNYVFDDLVDMHDYWGENTLVAMIEFCNRNNLHS